MRPSFELNSEDTKTGKVPMHHFLCGLVTQLGKEKVELSGLKDSVIYSTEISPWLKPQHNRNLPLAEISMGNTHEGGS